MNNITIELSTEDRARLDRVAEALERLTMLPTPAHDPLKDVISDVLKRTAPKAEKIATEEREEPTPPTAQPEPEAPTVAEETPAEEVKPTITTEQIRQKVLLMSAEGGQKKAKARDIVSAYAPKISDIPADKLAEVWEKITALEEELG